MIIAISNLKGGCGSTTLSLLLAHYLASLNKKVNLVDLDYKGTLALLHSRSIMVQEQIPFEFFSADISKAGLLLDKLREPGDELILLDLPKFSGQSGLTEIFSRIDVFIVPLQYDMVSCESSIKFSLLSARLSPMSKVVFLLNMPVHSSLSDTLEEQQALLRTLGSVCAPIARHQGLICLERMLIPSSCIFECSAALEILCENYLFFPSTH